MLELEKELEDSVGITFEQFMDFLYLKINGRDSIENLKRVFDLFDYDRKGFLDKEKLRLIA